MEDKALDECELFTINNFTFYNSRVYDRPIIFEKGSHALLHDEYVPIWYPGYCAINMPSYFESKADYIKYIPNKQIKGHSPSYYEHIYENSKLNPKGVNVNFHEGYHLLFRGTISAKHKTSGRQFLLVAGKSYIAQESDYDKNTEFYEKDIKDMIVFELEGNVYKLVNSEIVFGNFLKEHYDKVFAVLNVRNILDAVCIENINTAKKTNFDADRMPPWAYNKSELINE
ncbi:hypothetical protein MHTCC0001_18180 [Flavobacteriaceae bacterium MHTCC 0001]